MKTITVCTTSYVEVADDATETDAEEIVAGALETVDSVDYGRATSTDLNSKYAKDCTFSRESGTVFDDVAPAPCLAPFAS